ncbi:MAG: Nodulin-21 [Parcubacteria group bacterium]|nr:Nodulin-21 [Parcubacteria group bacterium]
MPRSSHQEFHAADFANKLNWLRASVLGSNDGVISIAALVVGVAGASASSQTLLVTGIAGLLAGAFSMAAGEYVSVSSQRDSERALLAKERYELEHFKESELAELISIYEHKGLKPETARQVAEELTAHDVFAAHVDAELKIDPLNLTNPWHAAIASAISYSLGGIIPLVAIILPSAATRIPITFGAVFLALLVTGVISARVSGARIVPTTLRVLAGGLIAMSITYGIGKLFNVSVP